MRVSVKMFMFVALAVASATNAAVIYSNLGPAGSEYLTGPNDFFGVGQATIGNTGNHMMIWAAGFDIQPGIWNVTGIDVPVQNITPPATASVAIFFDDNGKPGNPYWSSLTTFNNIPALNSNCCDMLHANVSGVLLSSYYATRYWMVVLPANPSNTDAWRISPSTGPMALAIDDLNSWEPANYTHAPAFQVLGARAPGSPTPEPATWALFGAGAATLAALRRARRI